MNLHILYGSIAFVIWSSFSTWYYVNYIKEFDEPEAAPIALVEEAPQPTPKAATTPTEKADEPETGVEEEVPTSINISRTFTFLKNSTELSQVAALGNFLDSLSQAATSTNLEFQVIGHACDLGTPEHNMELGERRASFVAKQINSTFDQSEISTQSKGESEPIAPNTSENNRRKNRRVTITINSKP